MDKPPWPAAQSTGAGREGRSEARIATQTRGKEEGVIRLLTTEEIGGRRRRSAANSERQRWKFGAHPHGVLNRWECDWLLESMRGSPHELF
jgi:hypothetical protein